MNDLDRSIIATLSYYGAMQWPLSRMEVHERLIPATRLGGRQGRPTIAEVFARLPELCRQGDITTRDGMYGARDMSPTAWASRVRREKETAAKWRRMRHYAWWLQTVPYARALVASGSLASGQASAASDWDVFVIARARRLYTTRVFLLACAWLMGRLRTKRHRVAPDRFCFNHYVTTDGLTLRHRGIFMAHALHAMVAIFDPEAYLQRLRLANGWTGDFVAPVGPREFVRREVPRSWALGLVRSAAELVLDTSFGDFFERALSAWQLRRIRAEPATSAAGGRVVTDAYELEFHPHSFERTLLERYNRSLKRAGMSEYCETDSGLTR